MIPVPLIPRRILFSNPDHASPQLSKDGRYLTYLAPWEGVLNIWYYDLLLDTEPQPLTYDRGRGIRAYGWATTHRHLIYIQDKEGDENWQIFVVDLESKAVRCLTPETGIYGQIVASSIHHPHEIIIGINHRNPELHDYYRVNILTGERTLVLENTGFVGVQFDNNLDLRFAMQMTPDGGMDILLHTLDATWEPFAKISPEDVLTTSIIGFTHDNQNIYLLDSRSSDTSILKCIDIQTKAETILAKDARADGSDFLTHPTFKTPQAYGVNYLRKSWQFFDAKMEEDFAFLQTVHPGDVEIVSRTLDDNLWIVGFLQDQAPTAFYLFERITRHIKFLFVNRSALANYQLQPMEPVEIKTRDGLTLVCYVTRSALNAEAGPLILNIHGGPRARDVWGFDPIHQWLANRGYSVISLNYRGSMGFGKNFMNRGNGEWGRAMHNDVIDVAEWAIKQGLAKRDQIGIMGGSYGGYATLIGLTLTPDYFACGVDLVGVSNLETFVASIPPYWRPVMDMLKVMLGTDLESEEGKALLKERSPLTYHHQLSKPLLIGHGANDPRVRQAESDQIVTALQQKNIPVIYLLYPDEGHGFVRPENRLSFYAVTEAFLAGILQGRHEPIGQDAKGSSLQIIAGKEYIKDPMIK